MDNLVLIRVVAVYDRTLVGAVVRDFREESKHTFRLLLASDDRAQSVVLSVEPLLPWTGRPVEAWRPARRDAGHFTATVARALRGAVLRGVDKPRAERRITFRFADGHALVAELPPHRSNLVLVDPCGAVVTAARRSRRDPERVAAGRPYRPDALPPGRIDPFGDAVEALRARLRERSEEGRSDSEGLAQESIGIGRSAADLLAEEARRSGEDLTACLSRRLGELLAGELDPVIETGEDLVEAVEQGRLDRATCRLLPWAPPWPSPDGVQRLSLQDAARTAGLYHAACERALNDRRRITSLRAILEREVRRLREVEARVAADATHFDDPERFRRAGEALLAGLKQARRAGAHVVVPDPYDAAGGVLTVAVAPEVSLPRAARAYFVRHRRAQRGLERARERATGLARRRVGLEALLERHGETAGTRAADLLEQEMRGEGIPVGLERHPGRRRGGAAPTGKARVEGVRIFVSKDGDSVLVGKTGKANQRLTFKLASPEDFWFHALGVPGAHVVVRNERHRARPSPGTMQEAAEVAAWFSEARNQPRADVQWTRRKYVRKLRHAPPGTVQVKRSETVRVQPRLPGALEGAS